MKLYSCPKFMVSRIKLKVAELVACCYIDWRSIAEINCPIWSFVSRKIDKLKLYLKSYQCVMHACCVFLKVPFKCHCLNNGLIETSVCFIFL